MASFCKGELGESHVIYLGESHVIYLANGQTAGFDSNMPRDRRQLHFDVSILIFFISIVFFKEHPFLYSG